MTAASRESLESRESRESRAESPTLADALELIAAGAQERDRAAVFPDDAFSLLRGVGVLAWGARASAARPPAAEELALVRSVARADGAVGRIFDGHVNAVERLAVHAPLELREAELAAVRAGRLLAGVWGGDPRPVEGEGAPAQLVPMNGGEVLRGVKTFCSGAGGLQRALVLARDPDSPLPVASWVDLTDPSRVEVDANWFRGSGMRASVSHRVVFHDAPVLGRLGPPGALVTQPWFGRDALRTAASWAGMADTAAAAALSTLAAAPRRSTLEELAAGRIGLVTATIEVWLGRAAAAMDAPDQALATVALHARVAIAAAIRELLDEAARACGSHPFAAGGALERSRRDLELFILQHRLDPMLARAGAAALDAVSEERWAATAAVSEERRP
jgi:hypothetical protein